MKNHKKIKIVIIELFSGYEILFFSFLNKNHFLSEQIENKIIFHNVYKTLHVFSKKRVVNQKKLYSNWLSIMDCFMVFGKNLNY